MMEDRARIYIRITLNKNHLARGDFYIGACSIVLFILYT